MYGRFFALFLFSLVLISGMSLADQVTDGSFESATVYTGSRCFLDNGILDFGDCKLSGSDQNFDVPIYWEMNTSIGDYAQVVDDSLTYLLGTGDYWAYSPQTGCYARNVESYETVGLNLTVYETCDATSGSYNPLSALIPAPFPYQESVALSGTKSLMVHNIPTLPCAKTGASCGTKNSSSTGFVWQNVTMDDSNYVLHFNVRNCDFTPPQCEEGWCITSNFGNPRNPTLGNFRVVIANESFSNIFVDIKDNAEYRDGWQNYDVYLAGTGLAGNYSLGLGVDSVSSSNAICVIYDNVSLSETPEIEVPSTTYIDDMNSLVGFPVSYTNHDSSGYSANYVAVWTSIGYDGTLKLYMNATLTTAIYWSNANPCNQVNQVSLYYTDGTSFQLGSDTFTASATAHYSGGWVDAMLLTYTFSIPDPDELDHIDIYHEGQRDNSGCTSGIRYTNVSIEWDADITTREIYTNVLSSEDSDDVLTGVPYLYPVIVYNNYVNDSGCSFWTAYNFKPTSESLTGNVRYTLFGEEGNAKQFGSETYTFVAGNSSHYNCWLDMDYVEETDYIEIIVESDVFVNHLGYNNNVTVEFPVTAGILGCTSRCIGSTYRTATELDGGACVYDYVAYSPICYTEPPDYGEVPDEYKNFTDQFAEDLNNTGAIIGTVMDDVNAGLPSDFKFIVSIIVSLLVGAGIGSYTKHWAMGGLAVLGMLCFFTVWGFFPWVFTLILILITAFAVMKMGTEMFTGKQ